MTRAAALSTIPAIGGSALEPSGRDQDTLFLGDPADVCIRQKRPLQYKLH
jgi:hypothetical protein